MQMMLWFLNLKNHQDGINKITSIVHDIGNISSAKVNWEKSSGLLVGDWREEKPQLPGGLSWSNGGFKYLAVYLGNNCMEKKNWEGILEMVRKIKKNGDGFVHICLTEVEY